MFTFMTSAVLILLHSSIQCTCLLPHYSTEVILKVVSDPHLAVVSGCSPLTAFDIDNSSQVVKIIFLLFMSFSENFSDDSFPFVFFFKLLSSLQLPIHLTLSVFPRDFISIALTFTWVQMTLEVISPWQAS